MSDAAKKKAAAKKLKTTAKLQGKDAADKQAAAMSTSAVRRAAFSFLAANWLDFCHPAFVCI